MTHLRNSDKKVMCMFVDRRKWLQENVAVRSLKKKKKNLQSYWICTKFNGKVDKHFNYIIM